MYSKWHRRGLKINSFGQGAFFFPLKIRRMSIAEGLSIHKYLPCPCYPLNSGITAIDKHQRLSSSSSGGGKEKRYTNDGSVNIYHISHNEWQEEKRSVRYIESGRWRHGCLWNRPEQVLRKPRGKVF